MADTATTHGSTDGRGAGEAGRERYQTDTRQPHSYVGFVTQEEHIGKLRHLEARVRREVAAEYVPLMAAHDSALTELISLRAEVAAQRPVVAAVERYEAVWQQVLDSVTDGVLRLPPDHHNTRIQARQALFDALSQSAHGSAPDAGEGG